MTRRHRRHSTAKKREVVEACLNGEALRTLSERHDVCRNLIRIWIEKHERGAYDDDAVEADLLDFPPSEPDSLGTCTARSGRDRLRRASRSRIARLIHRQANETVRLTVGPPRCETLVVIDTLPL